MRLISIIITGTLLLLGGAPADQKPAAPKCDPDGRYWVHHDKGEKVYCFDGDGFAAEKAPPHVKGYFEPAAPTGTSEGPASGNPTMKSPGGVAAHSSPSMPSAGGGGGGGGGGFSMSGGGGSSGGGGKPVGFKDIERMFKGDSSDTADMAGGGGGGRTKRDGPLPNEAFSLVAVGMSRTQVLAKLGAPHGRILNSGDEGNYEIWTYLTREGGSASVRIKDGRVVSLRLP